MLACRSGGPDSRCRCAASGRVCVRAGAADTGEDGPDDVVAEREQGGDGAGGVVRDLVTAGPAGFDDGVLAAQLAHRWAAGEVPAVGLVLFRRPPGPNHAGQVPGTWLSSGYSVSAVADCPARMA